MNIETDYSSYDLEKLHTARSAINAELFPERAAFLDRLIEEKESPEDSTQHNYSPTDQFRATRHQVSFHGSGSEFFGIWIVNIFLTIVTLGIYSAWAKVRTESYFYGNTQVAGHSFRYHAKPIQVLLGRIIALFLFLAYSLVIHYAPSLGMLAFVALYFISPLLICRSLRFKARMSSYRNVRFDFKGHYGEALVVFSLLPIVGIITLGIAMPWVFKTMDEFVHKNFEYGNKKFYADLTSGPYFKAMMVASGVGIVLFIVGSILSGFLMTGQALDPENPWLSLLNVGSLVFLLSYGFALSVGNAFYKARVRNYLYSEVFVDGLARFDSDVDPWKLAFIQGTNMVAIVLSLGLALPWARVRKAKYMASATMIGLTAKVQEVFDAKDKTDAAVGEEVSNLFDVDIALT